MQPMFTGLFAVGAATALLFAAGCSAETGTAVAAQSSPPSTTVTAAPAVVDGQVGIDGGGSTDIDVEIGDCVKLGGTMMAAEIDNAECGSFDSNYKVVAKADVNEKCFDDVDQYYYETLDGVEQGALCLDIDWVVGGCMSIPAAAEPFRVDCADPNATDVEQVTEILTGTADPYSCPEGGFAHDARQFVICTTTVA